jgi:type III secretory pathway component EscV
LGLKSRAFLVSGLIHLGAIALLQYLPSWQFLWTGIVTAGSLFLLAETQWDMQSNHDQLLSVEQKEFNRQQQQLRDLETQFSLAEASPNILN